MSKDIINVYSEIGQLKKVLLHRPGEEVENLTPEYLKILLFDDIPFLKVAREEHDNFAKVLQENGAEVLYLEDLCAESIKNEQVKEKFLTEVVNESRVEDEKIKKIIKDYLKNMPEKDIILKIMAGVRFKDLDISEGDKEYPFLMHPMPNLYFTRDPFASIGRGITINSMKTRTRRRETLFAKYIFSHHPEFKDKDIPKWYNRDERYCIEGGDELVLSKDILAIGHSARSDSKAILKIAKSIFENGESFKTILVFEIPKRRAFMHLDTVFTMVDYDKFTLHPNIEESIIVNAISYDYKNSELIIKEEEDSIQKILSRYLNRDIKLIRCGGGDKIVADREQWNDGSNTLAIAPGKVITYERNYVTNEILYKNNVSVISIRSSELSRGRGGPRCMSMPIYREDV
ncbi:arginine deiminase [Clostridium ganghwense]|uniref:Arginine deiminase n=1 Tax=Clostridium ganghwense TaxID=312089 RepID=A0ABT4CME6_9CLOT|nr:arginine deiminase [Clostridium ganghwense]MCY6370235.1 arginine deiminase [Clostridium ganghwense]